MALQFVRSFFITLICACSFYCTIFLNMKVIKADTPALTLSNTAITTKTLRDNLLQSAKKLEHFHLVAACRGDSSQITDPKKFGPISFYDLWVSGDSVQIRWDIDYSNENGKGDDWWNAEKFKPIDHPLKPEELYALPGVKNCYRPTGEFLWADSRNMGTKNLAKHRVYTLYTRSKELQPVGDYFLPLIQLDRKWMLPNRKGGWPEINFVAEQPLEHWKVLGEEKLDGKPTIKVEILKQSPMPVNLTRHKGQLEIAPTWIVWFSPEHGNSPVRIEASGRYKYQGKDYLIESPSKDSYLIYTASDYFEVSQGVWFPRSGKQENYMDDSKKAKPFDVDILVDNLLKNGKYVQEIVPVLGSRREWHVIDMKMIEPRNDLWFDPPIRAEVYNQDNQERFISGVSKKESDKLLGKEKAKN